MITYDSTAMMAVFGETIVYNTQDIQAVVTIGETQKEGNGLNTIGTSNFAIIDVAIADVPSPTPTDTYEIRGVIWSYVRQLNNDGTMKKLLLKNNTRHR